MSDCRAVRVNDQMICPCGRQWDVTDPEPPACAAQADMAHVAPPIAVHAARREYLLLVKRLYGIEGVKR